MTSSRRGFLASLLALLPLARSAKAGSVGTGTIRVFNGAPLVGGACVAPSITSLAQFVAVNPGTFVDYKGVPGSITAVSVLSFENGSIQPAIPTTYPAKGKIRTFSFYFTTDPATGVKTTVLIPV